MFFSLRCLLIFTSLTLGFLLNGEEKEFPTVIDFSEWDLWEIPGFADFDMERASQFSPFNGAIELTPFISYLQKNYAIETAIETGTFQGKTTAFLSTLFETVYTMEIDKETYENSSSTLQDYTNIILLQGHSAELMQELLPTLVDQRLFFYLDAHWFSDWPLLAELAAIAKTHRDHCLIIIDDFKVPGRPDIPYDSYGDHECSLEYIQDSLNQIFSSYRIHYLIPKNVSMRAKLMVIPKRWKK